MLPATAPFSSLGTIRFDTAWRLAAQRAVVDPAAVIDRALARTGAEFPVGLREAGTRA